MDNWTNENVDKRILTYEKHVQVVNKQKIQKESLFQTILTHSNKLTITEYKYIMLYVHIDITLRSLSPLAALASHGQQ